MERCLAATTADWRSDRRLGPTLGSSDPTEAQVIDRGINRYLIAIRQSIKVVLQKYLWDDKLDREIGSLAHKARSETAAPHRQCDRRGHYWVFARLIHVVCPVTLPHALPRVPIYRAAYVCGV
jgi:hypothetical protein